MTRLQSMLLLGLFGALVLGLALWYERSSAQPALPKVDAPETAPSAPIDPTQEIVARAVATQSLAPKVLTNTKSPVPRHTTSKYPPLSRIPIRDLPKVSDGIRMPDGTILPYLNGMTWAPQAVEPGDAGGDGKTSPVVALGVDQGGFEWWIHEDGSATTTRYKQVTANGETYWDPATERTKPQAAGRIMTLDANAPPGSGTQRKPGESK